MPTLPDEAITPRLHLRIWRTADAAILNDAVHDNLDHLRPWMPWIAFEPRTLTDRERLIRGWVDAWRDGGDAVYGAFDADGKLVASAGLHKRAGPECLEVGYWVHRDHLGKGYATELTRYLTDAAFTVDGIDRVELKIDQANEASARVPARLGFTHGEIKQIEPVAPGEVGIDHCWFVTSDGWPTPEASGLAF